MMPVPCCCGPSCTIVSDDFSTNTIANYDQRSGSWSASGGQLVPPSSGVLIGNTAAAAQGIKFSAAFNFGGASGTARWIVDYVDDNTYFYAEVVCTGSTAATLQLFKRSGGSNTAISPTRDLSGVFSWSSQFTIGICFSATSFTAVYDLTHWRMATVDDNGGLKAGVATASVGGSARFDDWSFTVLGGSCSSCTITAGCYGTVIDFDFACGTGTIAASFDVVSGTWTEAPFPSASCGAVPIGYITSASTDALAVYNTDVDNATARQETKWRLGNVVGQKARTIGAYIDSNNYLFAELEVTSGGATVTYSVNLYERRNGSNTLLASDVGRIASAFVCVTVGLCWDGTTAYAYVSGANLGSASAASDMVGYKVGVGMSGGGMLCYEFDYTCGTTCV